MFILSEIGTFTPEQYSQYMKSLKDMSDYYNIIDTAAEEAEIMELNGKYVLPGFVNTHVHTSQQISRGVGDDVDFITWLHKRMWPYESNMTEEDSYVSTLMTSLELIRSGVTSFAEPGGQFVAGMARATAESGLRGKLAKSVMDCGEGLPKVWQKTTQQELEELMGLVRENSDVPCVICLNGTEEYRVRDVATQTDGVAVDVPIVALIGKHSRRKKRSL